MVGGLSSISSVVGGQWFLWSMWAVVGGWRFAVLLIGGRFYF